MNPTCDICGKPTAPHERICRVCLESLLMDPENSDDVVYSIAPALDGPAICETRGLGGLMQTMTQLAPDIYEVRQGGKPVADATRHENGTWDVRFRNGLILAAGCMIV